MPSQSISVITVHHFNSLWKQLSFISSQKKGNFDQGKLQSDKAFSIPVSGFCALVRPCLPFSSHERKQTNCAVHPKAALGI